MTDAYTEYDPSAGGVGYFTWEQFDRFRRATENSRIYVPWLRVAGHIRFTDVDELRTRSSEPTLPIPATWLAAEEISRLLQELNAWPTLEDAASDLEGQFFAETFTREVETAVHRWPIEDKPHKVNHIRCAECTQLSLRYLPPRGFHDSIHVRCSNRDCGKEIDERSFATAVVLAMKEETLENWVNMKGATQRVERTAKTIYDWIRRGKVRTIKPGREMWVNVPDLLRAESEMSPGRPRVDS